VLSWAALAAAINAGQIPVALPTWAHVALAVVAILGAGHGARRQVTPAGVRDGV
jgi:hypothetical protein